MRVLLRKRYYCDHCKHANGSRIRIEKHEKGCTNNPNRECGICRLIGSETFPIQELQRVMLEDGWQALCEKVEHCPACILAASRQLPAELLASFDYEDPKHDRKGWDFSAALKDWWDEYNASQRGDY